jgi:hypothetical protein
MSVINHDIKTDNKSSEKYENLNTNTSEEQSETKRGYYETYRIGQVRNCIII